nr:hypothetical protein [Chlamydiota bacterium]
MSKRKAFSNLAFQKKPSSKKGTKNFNLVTEVKLNAFQSVFNTQPLSSRVEINIEKLLVENRVPGENTEKNVSQDIRVVKELTKEIKAIGNQGAFLIGERIAKAREVLKRYKKETFGSWLEETFGNKRTGYNFLAYYELWEGLPDSSLKEKYQLMPRKAAYMLASRTVGI